MAIRIIIYSPRPGTEPFIYSVPSESCFDFAGALNVPSKEDIDLYYNSDDPKMMEDFWRLPLYIPMIIEMLKKGIVEKEIYA